MTHGGSTSGGIHRPGTTRLTGLTGLTSLAGMAAVAASLTLDGCAGGQLGAAGPARPARPVQVRTQPAPAPSSYAGRRPTRRAPQGRLAEGHDPRRVTGTLTAPCHARDRGRRPDRQCTPGAIDRAVTQADIRTTICSSGYAEDVRPPESQTEAFKFGQAYPAYGIAAGTGSELDHLVPLELGGANDAGNLWPEAGALPNPKDAVEDALNKAVCDGQVSLARAQRAIARDWETAERRARPLSPRRDYAAEPARPPAAVRSRRPFPRPLARVRAPRAAAGPRSRPTGCSTPRADRAPARAPRAARRTRTAELSARRCSAAARR